MKKYLIAALLLLVVSTSYAWAAFQLWGYVRYGTTGLLVGSGKPVLVYESIESDDPGTCYTNGSSIYSWGFYGTKYFYMVSCAFVVGPTHYYGERIIDNWLSGDSQYDILVYRQ